MGWWKKDLSQTKSTCFLGGVCLGRGISKSSVVTASNPCTSGLHLCTLTACRAKNISVRENERSEVSMRKNKGCGLKKESVMCCRWGQSLKKRGREDRRVNFSSLWSKKHYYVLVVSHSSHHFLAVALPLGRPLASFLILFLWMSFCQLVVNASRAPWLSSLQRSSKGRRVSRSLVFSLGCQHHLHWLIHQGTENGLLVS